jgi:hypothetical protein
MGGIMEKEKKYVPSFVHSSAAAYFYLIKEMKGKMAAGGEIPTNEFRIFIKILGSQNRCYLIDRDPGNKTRITEGICTGSIWREKKQSILLENSDKLGAVIIQRNNKQIKEYQTYEEFWNEIGRG